TEETGTVPHKNPTSWVDIKSKVCRLYYVQRRDCVLIISARCPYCQIWQIAMTQELHFICARGGGESAAHKPT
ncbi:hypothetical protein, partial [Bradyrhizobium manausense]|uniref:hypothetical protein n=1 Tax=Bradyrhizobium manausense TaxID=989370 RepID=UPI001BAD72EA